MTVQDTTRPASGRAALAAVAFVTLGSAALLAGAWWFQLVLGLEPCRLCLEQRWPHYAALIVGAATLLAARGMKERRVLLGGGLAALAALFAASTLMAGYHMGVEWGWFLGPSDCGATMPMAPAGSMSDFMRQLETTRVISCTQVQWQMWGLSLAGWNAVFSAGLAAVAASALTGGDRRRRRA